jgi:hypothetical protein
VLPLVALGFDLLSELIELVRCFSERCEVVELAATDLGVAERVERREQELLVWVLQLLVFNFLLAEVVRPDDVREIPLARETLALAFGDCGG